MAEEISSDYSDAFNRHTQSPLIVLNQTSSAFKISADDRKFPLIVLNQNQECEMMNSWSSASAEENPEISESFVEKMVMCDSACVSSENGVNMRNQVCKIRNLDVELRKESLKVDAAHDSETLGAVEDVNQEVAIDRVEEKDFARSVLSFDGNQDCMKEELVQEVRSIEKLLDKEIDSRSILEKKKKLLSEEDEIHVEKGKNPSSSGGIVDQKIADQQNDSKHMNFLRRSHLSLRNSLKIEVIDETALVEPVHVSKIGNGEGIGIVCPTRPMQIKLDKSHEPDRGGKKAKRSRRRAREAKVSEMHWSLGNVNEHQKNVEGNKIVYSMKDMEALRFVNVAEQRRLWKAICKELLPAVAREYSSLTSSNYPMKIGSTSDPRQHLVKREEAPSIMSVVAARGRWNHMNIFVH
ncbi:uncharacterized protein LOC111479399 [Cucurbita maxima]|uniref:Uncharacterized protein LOC111479399 n=1 Tax=Cucurbita maxima TaxID=3661 RepID=A0A6J1IXM2_CUCMA|nr:uncharacterized protein LOC111479399 [Cucurbita maxima]